jgi:hypothetical protein
MKPSGAHTHPHSSNALPVALVVIGAAAVAAPLVHAAAALLRAVITAGAVCLAVAIIALAAFLAYRLSRARHYPSRHPSWLPARAARLQVLAQPRSPALERAIPTIHLHLYGVSADDLAEALTRPPVTSHRQNGG